MTLLEYLNREVKSLAQAIERDQSVTGESLLLADKLLTIAKAEPLTPKEMLWALLEIQGAIDLGKPVADLLRIRGYL